MQQVIIIATVSASDYYLLVIYAFSGVARICCEEGQS